MTLQSSGINIYTLILTVQGSKTNIEGVNLNTEYALLARFESPTISLKDISNEFFGVTPKTAEQQAKAGTFPIPTFKLRESERSPSLIHINDLAAHIDAKLAHGKEAWLAANPQALRV